MQKLLKLVELRLTLKLAVDSAMHGLTGHHLEIPWVVLEPIRKIPTPPALRDGPMVHLLEFLQVPILL